MSDSYEPFALKYRPQRFEDVVGQDQVARTLRNAVASGRVAHAYVFAGPRGCGKTSTARVFAKALNCRSTDGAPRGPGGVCPACVAIQHGSFLDVIEIDAATHNGVDYVRELREKVGYSPAEGRCKVYILDEAHQITPSAWNAFLKTLEEPPPFVYFIFASTAPWSFPDTIMSRCQRFDFRAIAPVDLVKQLRFIAGLEGVEADDDALWLVAEAAAGAMRDAESIFDKLVAYAEGERLTRDTVVAVLGLTGLPVLERAASLLAASDLPGLFALVDELVQEGKDLPQFVDDLTLHCRDLLRVALGAESPAWAQGSPERNAAARELAGQMGRRRLLQIIPRLSQVHDQLKEGAPEVLSVELALAEAAEPAAEKPAAPPARPAPAPAPPPEPAPPAPVTPAAAPAPPPPLPAAAFPGPDGPLTLEFVQERWRSVLYDQFKRRRQQPVGSLVCEGQPVGLIGDLVRIGFAPACAFHYNRAREQYQSLVEETLSQVLGVAVRVEFVLGETPAEEAPAPPPVAPETPAAPPPAVPAPPGHAAEQAIRSALDLFPGSQEVPEGEK